MIQPELNLVNENNRFEALFQFASIGILIVNQHAEIVIANAFLLNQFGYSDTTELTGKKIESLIPARFHLTMLDTGINI